jgi:hypothetical protein
VSRGYFDRDLNARLPISVAVNNECRYRPACNPPYAFMTYFFNKCSDYFVWPHQLRHCSRVRLKSDGTHAETRFRLSPKRTSPFKSAGASVHSNPGSRGVRISISNAGYTTFRGSVRVLATHSIRQFSLHFPSRASLCAIRFQTHPTRRTRLTCFIRV